MQGACKEGKRERLGERGMRLRRKRPIRGAAGEMGEPGCAVKAPKESSEAERKRSCLRIVFQVLAPAPRPGFPAPLKTYRMSELPKTKLQLLPVPTEALQGETCRPGAPGLIPASH